MSLYNKTSILFVGACAAYALISLQARLLSHAARLRKNLVWATGCFGGRFPLLLRHVRVPAALLSSSKESRADDEGLVLTNILIQGGKIAAIQPTLDELTAFSAFPIDCQGAIALPCFSDAHTHLIKTETVPRNRNFSGTMSEAMDREFTDQSRWKESGNEVFRRMEFAVKCALHYGTRAIRTHLDGCDSEDPDIRALVYNAYDKIQEKYEDILIVQGVANLYLPFWLSPTAKAHADVAKKHRNVVLGAYVGPTSLGDDLDPDTVKAMDALFRHALRLNMDCDLHIDETNDPDSCGLASLCVSLSKARANGYMGRVVLGHCCSLSLQRKDTQKRICHKLANLGAFVVANPFTNLGLQDRKGSRRPFSLPIPADGPRTPQWRGATLIQELRAANVVVAAASDNVRDHWYPYGDYDLLSVWMQVMAMGHLDTAPSEGAWADLITTAPAQAMGVPFALSVGEDADLVLFPSARRISELLARPQTDRLILRKGKSQKIDLPQFSELDDLLLDRI
jgi:cytosine deaminase